MVELFLNSTLKGRTGESMKGREIAAGLSNAGLSLQSVGAEVLLFLPRDFTDAYEDLWIRAHGTEVKGMQEGKNERVRSRRIDGRVKSDGVESMAPAASAKKLVERIPIGDEKALATKQRVDRKLRRIGREISRGMLDTKRRCTKCRKWSEPDWVFCPYDGASTEEV